MKRYAAPAAFLLAVTVAVLLIRSGLEHGGSPSTVAPPPTTTVSSSLPATTTVARKPVARKKFWVVQAGDTFAVISAKTGVPVATIEQLNPSVRSTSLFIGEKLRIK